VTASSAPLTTDALRHAVATDGYAFVDGAAMRRLLEVTGPLDDWNPFAASWNNLPLDPYMADGGRYRRRRHAVYRVEAGTCERQPHQAHHQSIEYNPLHGGVARMFEPVDEAIGAGASLRTILAFCSTLFSTLGGPGPWHVEVHQFRIEARPGHAGLPTPEGLHRDGVDYVLVLLISRRNIASGTTGIHALDGRPLGRFTLTDPFDAALVDDRRVSHGVTAVEAIKPDEPAYRDVVVVTFANQAGRSAELSEVRK
jgi:hypothetical protein